MTTRSVHVGAPARRALSHIPTLLALAGLAVSAAQASAALQFQTLMLSNTQAPGAPSGVKVNFFQNPPTTALDDSGNILVQYVAFPYPTSPNFRDSVAVGNGSTWTELARTGDLATATGIADVSWNAFTSDVARAQSGRTVFGAVLRGPGIDSTIQGATNNAGILMAYDGSTLTPVARNRDQVPGLDAGVNYFGLDGGVFAPRLNINNSGQMLINTYLRGTGIATSSENALLFRSPTGAITPLAQEKRATGITNVNFETIDGNRLNNSGQLVFRATLVGAPGHPFDVQPGLDDFTIWTGTSAGISILARGNSPIPGQAGRVWGNFSGAPGISDSGLVAFRGTMRGPGITDSVNDLALFRQPIAGGNAVIVAQKGVAAPGTEAGTTFLQMGDPLMSSTGDIVFNARLQGPSITSNVNEYALYAYRSSTTALVARQNFQATGLPSGVLYDNMYDAQVNSSGALAFTSLLKGTGVTNANNKAIYAEFGGVLTLVVREGDQLEVLPGVFKTIESLGSTGGFENTPPLFLSAGATDGQSRLWNDSGKLVFFASFTDGSQGIFITPPVPAPAAGGVLAACGILATRRRRR